MVDYRSVDHREVLHQDRGTAAQWLHDLEDLASVRPHKEDVEGVPVRGLDPRVNGDLPELTRVPEKC